MITKITGALMIFSLFFLNCYVLHLILHDTNRGVGVVFAIYFLDHDIPC